MLWCKGSKTTGHSILDETVTYAFVEMFQICLMQDHK